LDCGDGILRDDGVVDRVCGSVSVPKEAAESAGNETGQGVLLGDRSASSGVLDRVVFRATVFLSDLSDAQSGGNCDGCADDHDWGGVGMVVRSGRENAWQAVKDHELITQGPYSLVRNPIYLGMFGMLLATGLAVGRLPVLLAAIVVFLIGIEIRIRTEENLLREAFGEKFDEYARRVPALIPRRL
jgi:hypothetical protein